MEEDNVLKELGLQDLSQEEKDRILAHIADSLLKRLILRVYDRLNDNAQKEFDALAEQGAAEKINDFLRSKIPDLDDIRSEELAGLIEEMKDFFAAARR